MANCGTKEENMDMSDEELEKQFSKYKKEIIKCMRKVVYKHDLE